MSNNIGSLALSTPQGVTTSPTVVEPSVSSPCARARFEFEANGRGNDGSKILMIEWEEDELTRDIPGTWNVKWEGMPPSRSTTMESEELDGSETSSLTAKTVTSDESSQVNSVESTLQRSSTHRRYFLLGPRRNIPPTVTITLNPIDGATNPVEWRTNPLPAIFPKPLSGEDQGRLGVLHTQWAKMRLTSLDREIDNEVRVSPEGVALHMAMSERDWIVKKFGVGESLDLYESVDDRTQLQPIVVSSPFPSKKASPGLQIRPVELDEVPASPTSPVSPGGSRLSEKLKGLKLQTPTDYVAIPLCKGKVEKLMTATSTTSPPLSKPPQTTVSSNVSNTASMGSIGAMLATNSEASGSFPITTQREEDEAELFALPLSPRSPEMTKSPFSFAAEDTRRYASVARVS